MRVVFLTWRDTTHPDGGGSEVYVEQVARELVRRGHEVLIRCAAHPGATRHEVVDGVAVRRSGGRLTVYPRGLAWLLGPGRRYDAVVDVINGLPFGSPLVRRSGVVALVHHVHREQWRIIYPGRWGRLGWFVEGTLVPRLYARVPFLTVSEASRDDLVSLGLDRSVVTVASNGLATGPVVTVDRGPRVCVLARLVPHKRIDHALAVVEALRTELPDLHLDIVGDGWWRAELEAETRRRGLVDRVTFHGHLADRDRDRVLAGARAMLLPSVKEGWGLAILEAAAQGTPSVAYRAAGGVREAIVDGVTGILVEDLDGLTDATRRLVRDDALRADLGARARQRADTLDWASTTDVVERVLTGGQLP